MSSIVEPLGLPIVLIIYSAAERMSGAGQFTFQPRPFFSDMTHNAKHYPSERFKSNFMNSWLSSFSFHGLSNSMRVFVNVQKSFGVFRNV